MIWCACKRLGVKPPDVEDRWEDNDALTQAKILAFEQLYSYDEERRAVGKEI